MKMKAKLSQSEVLEMELSREERDVRTARVLKLRWRENAEGEATGVNGSVVTEKR